MTNSVKRIKKKNTTLFFDSFKHLKNNLSNLICLELPALVDSPSVFAYVNIKPVNYKSKYPDMRKIGLIDYDKPSDNSFSLTEEGLEIYKIIEKKKHRFVYNSRGKRLESITPKVLWKHLDAKEKEVITDNLIKALISYYDTADAIRPYLTLIKYIEYFNIKRLDFDTLCNIMAQTKANVLLQKEDKFAFSNLTDAIKEEVKRPISYIINSLETAGIIDKDGYVIYDREVVKEILLSLSEIYYEVEENKDSKRKGRSAKEQRKFRDEVLKAYDYKCAITGESIEIKSNIDHSTNYLLEAAHIIPYNEGGSFATTNGISLSIQLHKMFDKDLFAFEYTEDGNLEVVVTESNRVKDKTGILNKINHKVVTLPTNDKLKPDPDAIAYRREKHLLS